VGKSEFNFVQNIPRLLHIPHILRNAQVDHMSLMKHVFRKFNPETPEGWDERTCGAGKSEFNLVQNIPRLLHILHILRNAQVYHVGLMKPIASFQKICRGMGREKFQRGKRRVKPITLLSGCIRALLEIHSIPGSYLFLIVAMFHFYLTVATTYDLVRF
jgi:hypothetical protein